MSQPKLTREDIEKILKDVSFQDRQFLLLDKGDGYCLTWKRMWIILVLSRSSKRPENIIFLHT